MQVDGYSLDAQKDKLRKYAENQEMMYEAVWNSSRVAVSLSADTSIMREGLMGKSSKN